MEQLNKEYNLFDYQSSDETNIDGSKRINSTTNVLEIHEMTSSEWDERISDIFHKNDNNPNFVNNHGVPLLFHAINFGTPDAVLMLLEAGADANYVSWQGHSPWFLAVNAKNMAKIHLLENFHADQTIQNNLGHSALHVIAMRGDARLFHYLIHRAPPKAILAVNRWGNSLLHLTASWHCLLLTKICLTHTEIPVNLENHDGETAFLKAVKSGDIPIARLLLENGADINLTDHSGLHPMVAAIRYMKQEDETVRFLHDMLSAAAHPDKSDRWRETPLFLAVKRHWESAVELLLQYPIDVNHMADPDLLNRKDFLMSPIMMAVMDNQLNISRMLLTAHADVNSIFNKKTLLYHAVEENHLDMAGLLLEFGADGKAVSYEDPELPTPIQLALQNENVSMIELFVRKVNNPFEEDKTQKIIEKIANAKFCESLQAIANGSNESVFGEKINL